MSGREVLTSTLIAARVELIRHLQTVRRRGGRAAAAELEQKPLRISRRASSLPFGRLDLQDDGAESLGEVAG
jgi:hypothetical protein